MEVYIAGVVVIIAIMQAISLGILIRLHDRDLDK